MAEETIFTGKSVDEAIAEGLRTLQLSQDEADIEIISRGSRGIFGLGSEPAQVRITQRPTGVQSTSPSVSSTPQPPVTPPVSSPEPVEEANVPQPPEHPKAVPSPDITHTAPSDGQTVVAAHQDEDAEIPTQNWGEESPVEQGTTAEEDEQLLQLATELLGKLVHLMGFEAEVIATWREPDADNEQRYLLLDLQGKDLSPLIGRRGDTLGNMQYLVRLMVNQRLHRWKNIVVDVEGYRQRRIDHLSQLALRSAQQVAQTGRMLSLEPMAPGERRIIHLTLRDHPDVITESSGEGERRKVQILPRR